MQKESLKCSPSILKNTNFLFLLTADEMSENTLTPNQSFHRTAFGGR